MSGIIFKLIPSKNQLSILPLLKELNNYTTEAILVDRISEMNKYNNYKCVGVYLNEELIGMSGLWHLNRHYCGKTVEPDHVIIRNNYRNKGIGKLLFEWIYTYTAEIGCESVELNTYIENTKSHKFYENEDFKKIGFHYLKKI